MVTDCSLILQATHQVLGDRLLIRKFNLGDRDALRRIYEKYRNDLLKVALCLLNDKSMVEDIIHDVFISFAGSAGRFRLNGSLKGYLSICVANRARDMNKKIKRNTMAGLDTVDRVDSGTGTPVNSAMVSELQEQLKYAMSQLSCEQREVIVLRLQSRVRFSQIAKAQDVSVNTVQSRYRYGLDKLRSILTNKLSDEETII